MKRDFPQAASWVEKMHKDAEQRDAGVCVSVLSRIGRGLFTFIGIGFVDGLAKSQFNVTRKSTITKKQQLQTLGKCRSVLNQILEEVGEGSTLRKFL
ncbi:hypothetical protein BGX38DRAFT_1183572 [Terfezia claveryi]|nr:hypothetical protein BGX38DRAFT_1183572 [Terfezia claveryi]